MAHCRVAVQVVLPVSFGTRRISISRTAIMVRYDCIRFPCVRLAVCSRFAEAGCSSAISPTQATSRAESSQVSLNAAPTALEPMGGV